LDKKTAITVGVTNSQTLSGKEFQEGIH